MRTYFFVAALCADLMAAGPINGQGRDATPAIEVFFGGSKLWEHAGGGLYHNHGPELALTGNFNRFLGLEVVFSKFQGIPLDPPASGDYFRFLLGPHFACNANSRVGPFGHVLVGVTHGRQNILPPYPPGVIPNTASALTGRTAFTAGFGGGLDVKVFRFFWVRPIQADYVHAFFPNAAENNLQLSFGATLRFGNAGKNR